LPTLFLSWHGFMLRQPLPLPHVLPDSTCFCRVEVQQAEIGAAACQNGVHLIGCGEIATDECWYAHLITDALAQRRQKAAPIAQLGVRHSEASEHLNQVAAGRVQSPRQRDDILRIAEYTATHVT